MICCHNSKNWIILELSISTSGTKYGRRWDESSATGAQSLEGLSSAVRILVCLSPSVVYSDPFYVLDNCFTIGYFLDLGFHYKIVKLQTAWIWSRRKILGRHLCMFRKSVQVASQKSRKESSVSTRKEDNGNLSMDDLINVLICTIIQQASIKGSYSNCK